LVESPIPEVKDGQALVKVVYLSCDPAQRGWISDKPSYLPPQPLNTPFPALGVGKIIESKNPKFPVGRYINGFMGWQDYAIFDDNSGRASVLPEGVPPNLSLHIIGGVGFTAYFGLLDVCKPKEGEVVLVSGAAGATGAFVCQIAKIKKCTVIGIAGGADKLAYLKEIGVDHVIDYKSDNVKAKIKEFAPNGVNVYFDNVGGDILEAALDNLALKARIAICGGISQYNAGGEMRGPRNYLNLIGKRARMEGFLVLDYADRFQEAGGELFGWFKEGKLKYKEDIQDGLENALTTWLRLFDGKNIGKQAIKVSDP